MFSWRPRLLCSLNIPLDPSAPLIDRFTATIGRIAYHAIVEWHTFRRDQFLPAEATRAWFVHSPPKASGPHVFRSTDLTSSHCRTEEQHLFRPKV
jgi:hypothetical protein